MDDVGNEQESWDRRKKPIQSAPNNLILLRLNKKNESKEKSTNI